jgi:hypothetical protein
MSRRTKHELNFSNCKSITIETDNSSGYYEKPNVVMSMYEENGFIAIKFEDADELQELIDSLELAKKELL